MFLGQYTWLPVSHSLDQWWPVTFGWWDLSENTETKRWSRGGRNRGTREESSTRCSPAADVGPNTHRASVFAGPIATPITIWRRWVTLMCYGLKWIRMSNSSALQVGSTTQLYSRELSTWFIGSLKWKIRTNTQRLKRQPCHKHWYPIMMVESWVHKSRKE